jgi:hypothetical protein
MNRKTLLFALLFSLFGCDRDDDDNVVWDIVVTDEATNLVDLNSEYDDYNSDLGYPHTISEIFFSSKRTGSHDNYDVVEANLQISYHKKAGGVFNVSVISPSQRPLEVGNAILPKINDANNQLGPHRYITGNDLFFLYGTEVNGVFAIHALEYTNWNLSKPREISEPFVLSGINARGDNLYPCIDEEKNEMFFCSNRKGSDFDIYSAKYSGPITKQSLMTGEPETISMIGELSGEYDDKCPIVDNDLMVFTSNRPGGFGGFDLWYSYYENGSWTTPGNFGSKVNSEFDDYRPIIVEFWGAPRMMIFSSNRPGGKGGFDLYAVKIGLPEK